MLAGFWGGILVLLAESFSVSLGDGKHDKPSDALVCHQEQGSARVGYLCLFYLSIFYLCILPMTCLSSISDMSVIYL